MQRGKPSSEKLFCLRNKRNIDKGQSTLLATTWSVLSHNFWRLHSLIEATSRFWVNGLSVYLSFSTIFTDERLILSAWMIFLTSTLTKELRLKIINKNFRFRMRSVEIVEPTWYPFVDDLLSAKPIYKNSITHKSVRIVLFSRRFKMATVENVIGRLLKFLA